MTAWCCSKIFVLYFNLFDSSEWHEVLEGIFLSEQTAVDAGTDKDTAMRKHGDTIVGTSFELVEKGRDATVEHGKTLAAGGFEVHIVFVPRKDMRVFAFDVIVAPHLPFAHVYLFEAVVERGGGVAAVSRQLAGTRQR